MRKQKLREVSLCGLVILLRGAELRSQPTMLTDTYASLTRAWIIRSRNMHCLQAVVGRVQFPISCLTRPLLEMQKCLPIPNPHRLLPTLSGCWGSLDRGQSVSFPVWLLSLSEMEKGLIKSRMGHRNPQLFTHSCLRPGGEGAEERHL